MSMPLSSRSLAVNSPIRRIGFIGYGYVGSATAAAMAEVADVQHHDPAMSDSVDLAELVAWAEVLYVCVPTPRGPEGRADVTTVMMVMAQLTALEARAPIVLKSTVPPGTCAAVVARWPRLRLVFSPEFLRERHHVEDANAPARVLLGWTTTVGDEQRHALRELIQSRFPHTPLAEMDAANAELVKYASNALFGVKVSFANEMRELAVRLGLDWEQVRRTLVLDPRVGDGHLCVPGPDGQVGFGGSCLPKDMRGLLAVARDAGVELDVVKAAVSANIRRRRR